jgi:hypothetical protein
MKDPVKALNIRKKLVNEAAQLDRKLASLEGRHRCV